VPPSVLLSLPAASGALMPGASALGLGVGIMRTTRLTAPGVDVWLLRSSAPFGRNTLYH
jgi:hypothetical protein